MAETRKVEKVGIVISGGLSRGSAQLTFAKEIINKIGYDKIACVTGTSIGAFNSYAVGINKIDELIDLYSQIDIDSVSQFMKKIRRDLFNKLFNRLYDEHERFYIPSYAVSTKLAGIEAYYFCLNTMDRMQIKQAINASMSYPFINGPRRFLNQFWVDGGITDNVPILPMLYYDLDMIIILHCYPKYYPPAELYDKFKKDTIVVDVDISLELPETFNPYSFTREEINAMLEEGRIKGRAFCDKVFGSMDYSRVKQRCYEFTRSYIPLRACTPKGQEKWLDILNSLYELKEDII